MTSTVSPTAGSGAERPRSRFVAIDGCFNFRDLGGYRTVHGRTVAWGRLYRADGLHRITATGATAFQRLGVTSVLDLRTPEEVAERRWAPPAGWPGHWRHLPLLSVTPDWSEHPPEELARADFAADHYRHLTEVGGAALRTAVESLATSGGLPAVFHCAAGKDRTGVLAAVVLRLLGVDAQTVADDYALSEEATARWEASLGEGNQDDTRAAWSYVPPSLLRAERETMLGFLRHVEGPAGSADALAARLGIDADTVQRLGAALLD